MDLTYKAVKMGEDKYPVVIPEREILEVSKVVGSDGYLLYWFYHTKGTRWAWRLDKVAETLGWNERKVMRIRDRLKDNGYLFWFRKNGDSFHYIGRTAMAQAFLDYKEKNPDGKDIEHFVSILGKEATDAITQDNIEEMSKKAVKWMKDMKDKK